MQFQVSANVSRKTIGRFAIFTYVLTVKSIARFWPMSLLQYMQNVVA